MRVLVAVSVVTVLLSVPKPAHAGPPLIEEVVSEVRELAASEDPEARAKAIEMVDRGLPPPGVVAFLAVAHHKPHPDFAPVLRRLLQYRRAEIRGRAATAMLMLGGRDARVAVLTSLDDADVEIRRVGVKLAAMYEDPAVQVAVASLREREPELFAEDDGLIVAEAPPPPPNPEAEDGADVSEVDETSAEPEGEAGS